MDYENAEVTLNSMKPLDESVIHKICSGQIITTLAVAVKELIENSLDAGAKTIEVKLKDYGSTLIEVRDDGSGIDQDNRPVFALKNYTSKISTFSDIYNLNTYGFRGEAINSLCAVGDVSVITRHENDSCGVLLEFDRSGNIILEKPHARMIGTTIFVKNMFSALPVRRKLLLANLKREYGKAIDLIKAYCLVTIGTRIICSNQLGEKSPSSIVVTDGISILGNISSAFGVDQVKHLLAVPRHLPDLQVLEDFHVSDMTEDNEVQFDAYISSCSRGEGRNLRDRQFMYVNSRPCDYEKICRLVNYIFHQYQKRRYPFLFLNLKLPNDTVDVNCSPDKREIILKNEKLVLATIKASLLALFQSVQSVSTIESNKLPSVKFKLDNSFLKNEENSDQNDSFVIDGSFEMDNPSSEHMCVEKNLDYPSNKIQTVNLEVGLEKEGEEEKIGTKVEKLRVQTAIDTLEIENESENLEGSENNCSVEQNTTVVVDDNERCYNSSRMQTIISVESLINNTKPKDEVQLTPMKEQEVTKFRAALDPAQNDNAEKELRQQITKEMFLKMEIVGQLNKSFIIVRLDSHLFIIDQHAADEIYNFETLMKSSTIQSQRLVVYVSELFNFELFMHAVLLECLCKLAVSDRNGFHFPFMMSVKGLHTMNVMSLNIGRYIVSLV